MKRLSPDTKKEIIQFFLNTATKRILEEELNKDSCKLCKIRLECKFHLGSNIT